MVSEIDAELILVCVPATECKLGLTVSSKISLAEPASLIPVIVYRVAGVTSDGVPVIAPVDVLKDRFGSTKGGDIEKLFIYPPVDDTP